MADEKGMRGALTELAYGEGGESPMAQLPGLLKQLSPEGRDSDAENLAFWGGFGKPNTTGQLSGALGNAMGAQSDMRLERDKLRAAYIPLIMQSLVQGQDMTVKAANASRDYLKDINPKVDTQLAALRTGDAQPTYGDVINRTMQLGQEYQIPQAVLMSRLKSIPKDPAELNTYLDRLAAGQAGADKMVGTVGNNAAGQSVLTNPNRATVKPLRAEGAGANGQPMTGADSSNPTKPQVDWVVATQGDPKAFEQGLRTRVDSYKSMLARMNEQAKYVDNFQPGRYAGIAGGLAAAIKDIGTRLPGVDPKTVESLASKIVGSPVDSPQSVASLQLFKQLAQQETLAQLKTSLGENQRMNQAEYQNFNKGNLAEVMDPETFKGMRDFYYKEAAKAANHYVAWSEYTSNPNIKNPSVTAFDSKWAKGDMEGLLSGSTEMPAKGALKPTYPGSAARPTPAPAAPAAAAPTAPDLSMYEPGTKVGPTGKAYVIENGVPRPAQSRAQSGKLKP